jgi:hypothetical protein
MLHVALPLVAISIGNTGCARDKLTTQRHHHLERGAEQLSSLCLSPLRLAGLRLRSIKQHLCDLLPQLGDGGREV